MKHNANAAFHWRDHPSVISWKKDSWAALISGTASGVVDRIRREGGNGGSVHGISVAADTLIAGFKDRDSRRRKTKELQERILKERQQITYSKARPK